VLSLTSVPVPTDTAVATAHVALSSLLMEQGAPACTAMIAAQCPMDEIAAEAIKHDVLVHSDTDGEVCAMVERWVADLVTGRADRVLASVGAIARDGCFACGAQAFDAVNHNAICTGCRS